jgi:hypothetical protein
MEDRVMKRILVFASVLLATGACRDSPRFLLPTAPVVPVPSPPVPPSQVRVINVGEEVRDRYMGSYLAFDVTVPSSGKLRAELMWDVQFNGSLLVLQVDGAEFKPSAPQWTPVIGRVPVVAGRTYRLMVKGGGTDWWYDDPFALKTAIEQP